MSISEVETGHLKPRLLKAWAEPMEIDHIKKKTLYISGFSYVFILNVLKNMKKNNKMQAQNIRKIVISKYHPQKLLLHYFKSCPLHYNLIHMPINLHIHLH